MNKVFITGVAGFIGSSLAKKILEIIPEASVIGIDNLNDYYDVNLKKYRLEELELYSNFVFYKGDISDKFLLNDIFEKHHPNIVVNLAAQAGVRYSITHPDSYIKSNINGFFNVLEACRHSYDGNGVGVQHLVYASSSSVYGDNKKTPYSTSDPVDSPVSLYAATKKSNELLAQAYSKLYNIPCTGLRFFTVYGPAGRPDMAYFKFVERLKQGKKIQIYNYGECQRDFTFIDDIIKGILLVILKSPKREKGKDGLPLGAHCIYNIGRSRPEKLLDFVDILQKELLRVGILSKDFDFETHKEFVPMQPGDVPITYADTTELERDFGYKPTVNLKEGLRMFVDWYAEYYR